MTRHGTGTFVFKNGNKYEGDWDNNQRHGYGRMIYVTNTHPLASYFETFEGEWKRNELSGKCRIVVDQSFYDGQCLTGKPTGRGSAIAGLVCSAVALLACIGWFLFFGAAMSAAAAAGA